MGSEQTKDIRDVLEGLDPTDMEGRASRTSIPPSDHSVLDEPGSWLAPELLEMLMATVRIGLDGQEVVNLAVLSPELYGDKECFWSLDQLRDDIRPQRRADD
jgi:hypothetical protein